MIVPVPGVSNTVETEDVEMFCTYTDKTQLNAQLRPSIRWDSKQPRLPLPQTHNIRNAFDMDLNPVIGTAYEEFASRQDSHRGQDVVEPVVIFAIKDLAQQLDGIDVSIRAVFVCYIARVRDVHLRRAESYQGLVETLTWLFQFADGSDPRKTRAWTGRAFA